MPRPPKNPGFIGVRWDAPHHKWKVSVWDPVNFKLHHGGYFEGVETDPETATEARRRYDEMVIEICGATRLLNFPREAREAEAKRKAAKVDPVAVDGAKRASG